jgi:hypothetical protein
MLPQPCSAMALLKRLMKSRPALCILSTNSNNRRYTYEKNDDQIDAQPALAYIDPNTGGVLFQVLAILLASFSAILLVFSRQIRMAFARVKRFLHSLLNR